MNREFWELCEIFFRARYSLLAMALPAILGLMAYRSRVPGTVYSLLLLRAFGPEGKSPKRFLHDLFVVTLLSFTVTGLGGVGVRLVQLHGDERFDTSPSGDETRSPPCVWPWLTSAPPRDQSFVAWPPLLLLVWGVAGSVLPAACAWVGLREGSLTPALQMPKRQHPITYPVLATVKSLVNATMLVAGLAIVAGVIRQVLWGNEDWVLPFSSWLTGGNTSSQGLFGTRLLGYSPVPGYVSSDCVVHRGHLDMTLVLIFAGFFYVLEFVRDSWRGGNVGTRSTGTYLLVCIGLAGVILQGTAFWFDRYGWSPLLLASILAGALYWWFRTDHYFRVDAGTDQGQALRRPRVDDRPLPDIAAVIRERTFPAGPDGKRTLFVVAAAGGGIQASAWTARVLTGLGQHPLFKKSLGLISAVSGGSVGSAYFLLGAYRGEEGDRAGSGSTHAESARTTDLDIEARINKKARQSLLEPVAWGAAFTDIPRLFTGCFPWNPLIDRGWALEQALESRFGFDGAPEVGAPSPMLRDLCQRVHPVPVPVSGPAPESPLPRMPIPLFNATCVETGQRIIMAPVRFSDERRPFNRQRPIHFLTDYSHGSVTASPTLATAVRLSATFCYASPVARPTRPEAKRWAEQFAGDDDRQAAPAFPSSSGQSAAPNKAAEIKAKKELYKLHLCDGGYADNTGVVSAMDACRSIIAGFEAGADRPFDQIVLVRIDPFPKPQTSVAGTNEGFLQAVFGPVVSLLSARSATQLERADREIERCAEFARDRGIALYSTLIRFGDHCHNGTIAKPPLSWALSARQEDSIEDAWSVFTGAIDRHWAMPGCAPGREISLGSLLGPKR